MVQVAPETLADVARQVIARRVVATPVDVMVFFVMAAILTLFCGTATTGPGRSPRGPRSS
jgi:hypothetical protein